MLRNVFVFCIIIICFSCKSIDTRKVVDVNKEIILEGTFDSMITQIYENLGYHLFFFSFEKYGTKEIRYFINTFDDNKIDYGIWSNCLLEEGEVYQFKIKEISSSVPDKTIYSFIEKKWLVKLSSPLFEEYLDEVLKDKTLSSKVKESMLFPNEIYFDMDNNIFSIEDVSPCSSRISREKIHRGF